MITVAQMEFGYDGRPVLRDLSFTIPSGGCLGVLGANGSGKSTLCKLLGGLLLPQQGTIHYDGRLLQTIPRRERARQIAYVPQETAVAFPLRVREVVLLGRLPHLRRLGWEGPRDRAAAVRAMAAMECTALADRSIQELSGGERQRTFLARALAQEPTVLICDEPTTHLDLKHQIGCLQLLRQLQQRQSTTMIIALHDLNLAAQFCDTVCLLHGEHIHAIGHPTEVLTPAAIATVFDMAVCVARHPVTGRPLYAPTA